MIIFRNDLMSKSFQVALIIMLLGYTDTIVVPLGVPVLAVVVSLGLYYVFDGLMTADP
jgi:hypothetical protein